MPKLNINNGGVDTNKKMADIDERYGPYTSLEAANAALGSQGRNTITAGLTVGILTANAGVKEYWYQPNEKGQLELVEKKGEKGDKGDKGDPIAVAMELDDTDIAVVGTPSATIEEVTPAPEGYDQKFKITVANLKGEQGKSAYEVWKEIEGNEDKTVDEFMEYLAKNWKFNPKAYYSSAASTIGGTCTNLASDFGVADAKSNVVYLMPNLASNPTATRMYILNDAATAFVYVGDMDIDASTFVKYTNIDISLANPTDSDVASAKAVMQLKAKLEGVTASDVKVNAVVGTNVTTGAYVSGETGLLVTPGSSASSYAYFELAIPQGTKSIRFATGTITSSGRIGYSIGHYEENVYVPTRMFYFDVAGTTPPSGIVEKVIEILDGDTTFRTTVAAVSTYSSITLNDFYCYLQSGETVKNELNKKVNTSDFVEYESIRKNLFDKESFQTGKYILNTSSGWVNDANAVISQKLYLQDKREYTVSNIIIGGTGDTKKACIVVFDSNDDVLDIVKVDGVVTESSPASGYWKDQGKATFVWNKLEGESYCRIEINYNVNNPSRYRYAQLEVGGEATSYANYNEFKLYDIAKKSEFDNAVTDLDKRVDDIVDDIKDLNTIQDGLRYLEDIVVMEGGTPVYSRYYYGAVGSVLKTRSAVSTFGTVRYDVEAGVQYYYSNKFGSGIYSSNYPIYGLIFTDGNNIILDRQFLSKQGSSDSWVDVPVIAPSGAVYAYVNFHTPSISSTDFLKEPVYSYIKVDELKEDVDELMEAYNPSDKLMKVVIGENSFRVRTKFSDSEDIIIRFEERILSGGSRMSQSLTLNSYYVGANTLTDGELMASQYKIGDPDDTISAISFTGFGPMTGQHGWSIARCSKTGTSIDSSDLNSVWHDKDNSSRTFVLGYISDSYLYFFPVITDNDGIYGTTTGAVFNNLPSGFVHDSGAIHTTAINNASSRYDLRVETSQWDFFADNHKVGTGTYYCDDFVFTESVIGHSPVGVSYNDWMTDNTDAKYDESKDFVALCRSYVFKGASMTYNLSFNTLYPFKLSLFYFLHPMLPIKYTDTNSTVYHANLFVPKAKGICTPYINDTGTETGKSYPKYRNTSDLYNVNDIPDRAIGFLKSDSNAYKLGMVGGLSLVDGITVKQERNAYLANISPSTDVSHFGNASSSKNKWYTRVLLGSSFSNEVVPTTFVKDVSGYICWFNPNKNAGLQVYDYKASDCYVVYIHAQATIDKVAINLPSYLEGMMVDEVVEKTDGATLLTNKVMCGKLYVKFEANNGTSYATNDNYIVFKVK